MEKIIYKLVFNQEKHLTREGKALIQVEATQQEKKRYLSTKVFIRPDQWDPQKLAVKNHSDMDMLNRYLQEFIYGLERKELDIVLKGESFDIDELLIDRNVSHISFTDFMKKEIDLSHSKISTKKNHYSTWKILCQYQPNIQIKSLTYSFLCSFESFLLEKKYHRNTIAKHMRHLKRYVNLAINKDLFDIAKYPFRKYKIHYVESPKMYLTPEELNRLENLDLTNKRSLKKCLDIFLFSCYTGLRFSDIAAINSDHFLYLDNQLWLAFSSTKTEINIRIPIYLLFEGKAISIYKKYASNPFFFNIDLNSNSNINKQLRVLAKLGGIEKKISFHTARHTNATLLLYKGAHITTVQKLLGHKSVKTTEIYSKIMDMTIIKDLEKIY